MIGVRLMGGLGNQMFQYALGKKMSLRLGKPLGLDLIFFENIEERDTLREYELDCFKLNQRFISSTNRPQENRDELYKSKRGALLKLRDSIAGKPWHIYHEAHHQFDMNALSQPDKTYFIGYWQTEKYFADIREELLKDFQFKTIATGKNAEHMRRIESTPSISIHVRRGDYISNPHANKFHGLAGKKYYEEALKLITSKVKKPELFVISDDPDWCKKNLKFPYPTTYITGNSKGFEDMRLMSLCQHNIIANSTFSWWAAWLNQNPNKIVVAPKNWFANNDVDTSDVIPSSWLKI